MAEFVATFHSFENETIFCNFNGFDSTLFQTYLSTSQFRINLMYSIF